MDTPVLYIIAGPNGIGKTTCAFDITPQNIPIISSDEIAKQVKAAELVKTNTQEYSNREAQLLLQQHMDKKATFAIETNLSDDETWKFLKGIKKWGYLLHLVYLCTDDLDLLNSRIYERSLRGEHFVRPDIVEERYFLSLKLLNHYFTIPDIIQLIDNSETLRPVALIKEGHLESVAEDLPAWFTKHLKAITAKPKESKSVKDLSSIDEVRKRYQQRKK
jgi:predicted ABC-type ATPase